MLLQRKNGYVGLPSPFSHSSRCLRCSSGTESSGLSRRSSARNHESFATAALGWRSLDQFLSPDKEITNETSGSLELSCLRRPGRELGRESLSPAHRHRDWSTTTQQSRGIGLSTDVVSSGGRSHPTIGRWHSLSRLLSHDSGASGPIQPWTRRRRSVSEQDLRACSLDRVQKEAELATFLKEADRPPRREIEELGKLEVDLNVMKFELLSLKQRMESSFAVLEKEKTWLEMLSSGDRKRKWKRKDKIFPLKLELLKAKSYSGKRRNGLLLQDSSQKEDMGKKDVSRETPALQETQVAQEGGIQALLDQGQETAVQQLKSTREGQRMVPDQTTEANQRGANSSQANQTLHEGTGQLQATDKSFGLANRELSLEVAQSCQSPGASLDSRHHLEAEKKDLQTSLENERARLLGEREGRIPEGEPDGPSVMEEVNALQATCGNLRESQSRLQKEKDVSETHCLELEVALRSQREEMERQLAEQKQVSQYWQDRWEQVDAALKKKEEELEEAHLHSQASSVQQLETPLLLQEQLDICKQELELDQNHSQVLHHSIQHQEPGSKTDALPTSETALQEVDTEVALVREELQKVWDMLKSRDAELEEKHLELETARNQYAECSSEKQHLDRLVASLEEQLAEKEQALRHLEKAEEEDRAEKEMKVSLLERKLAEMEAAKDLPGREFSRALETQEVRENVPGEDSRSQGTCRRCSAALAQLNQVVQSAEKREKEDQTLAGLYRLQDLLKGSLSDRPPSPMPVQNRSQDPTSRVIRSPQEEKEILRRRHQLVTEQLKGIFRQRQQQQLEQSKQQSEGGKEERLWELHKSQEVPAAPESPRPPEEEPAAPDDPSSSAEVQRLQQLLKEKTETISAMASEIQSLQQKNEALMKAKLRFQQQIQLIRNLPKQRPERSAPEFLVPRLSVSLGQDLHSNQGSDSSVPSPRSDEPSFTGSREDLSQSHLHAGAEDQRRGSSSDEGSGQVPRAPPSPPIPAGPPAKPFFLELTPSRLADSEGASPSPQGSALLSPRPFGPPRPWSPFKFRGNPELPEDEEKH